MNLVEALARLPRRRAGRSVERLPAPDPRDLLKRVIHARDLLPGRQSGKPLEPDDGWTLEKAIDGGLRIDVLVYSAFRSRAQTIGSIPWTADVKADDGSWEPAPDHEIVELLDQPNPHTSGQEFEETNSYHLDLVGNALDQKLLLGRTLSGATRPAIAEMYNLVPEGIFPVPLKTAAGEIAAQVLQGYAMKSQGQVVRTWEPDEICHLRYVNPGDPFWGLAPLQAMARVVDTQIAAVEWNMDSMDNRAISDGVFSTKEAMSRAEWEAYREMVYQEHTGADNAHAPWVLGGGLSWQPMSRTPVEMDFVAGMQLLREMILSGADVPPVIAGFFDKATLANAEASRRLWWVDKIIPHQSRKAGVYRRSLVPHFGDPKKLRVRSDYSNIEALAENRSEQSLTFQRLVRNGVPYNDAITVTGLPLMPIEGDGDIPYGVALPPGGASALAAPKRGPYLFMDGESGDRDSAMRKALGVRRRVLEPRRMKNGGYRLHLTAEAKVQAEAAAKPILGAVRDSEKRIRSAFESGVRKHRRLVKVAEVRDALATGQAAEVLDALQLDALEDALGGVTEELAEAVADGAKVAAREIQRQTGKDVSHLFDLLPEDTLAHGRDGLAALLVDTNRKGIEKAARSWFEKGEEKAAGDAEVAALFAEFGGLTQQQVTAALKEYREQIAAGASRRKALNRAKLTIAGYLEDRAEGIAGQETTVAVHLGQKAFALEAQRQNEVARTSKTWVTAQDADVCEICDGLAGQTVDGEEDFYSPLIGQVSGAGDAHVKDRCGELWTYELE